MLDLSSAVRKQRPCNCACHKTLSASDRARGLEAIYVLDDALRGWGYRPNYELHGDALWREAQRKNDPTYREVAVRFGECMYRRLLGSMIHECLHAVCGEAGKPNYGIPFGLPYGVPNEIAPSEEESYLRPFNFGEARAFVGVWILGKAMFAIDWSMRTARDVGTYGFVGGNALVPVPPGFRPVAHLDRVHHEDRYYVRARAIEDEARAWFTEEAIGNVRQEILSAAEIGKKKRPSAYPDPKEIARATPAKIGRNEPCVCGSALKYKDCCEGASRGFVSSLAR